MLVLSLALGQIPCGYAQTATQPDAPTKVAALRESSAVADVTPGGTATAPDSQSSQDILKELAAMKARIEQLEAELKSRSTAAEATPAPASLARTTEALRLQLRS